MAKTIKKTSVSKKSGNKKFSVKKNWKKLAYFGIIALLVISVLSYAVVNKIENDRSAKAAYSTFGTINGVRVDYCKYYDQFNQLSYKNRFYNTQSSVATVYNYVNGQSYYPIRLSAYQAALGLGGGSQLPSNSTYRLNSTYRVDRGTNSTVQVVYFSFAQMGWC